MITSRLPKISDTKLDEYLSVWTRGIEEGRIPRRTIRLYVAFPSYHFPSGRYYVEFSEEVRELSEDQALVVQAWITWMRVHVPMVET